jgi:uncharacterized protein YhhL (DUF1145 family)
LYIFVQRWVIHRCFYDRRMQELDDTPEDERDDEPASLFKDLDTSFARRMKVRYTRRIKVGRTAMFVVAFFSIVTLAQGVPFYEQGTYRLTVATAVAVFYFTLMLMSVQKPYLSFVIAAIAYIPLGAYKLYVERLMFAYLLSGHLLPWQEAAYFVLNMLRILVFYVFVMGAIYSKKLETLHSPTVSDEE